MLQKFLTKIIGSKTGREVNRLLPDVARINEATEGLSELSEEELRGKTDEFRSLPQIDQDLLSRQSVAMREYFIVLGDRIARQGRHQSG